VEYFENLWVVGMEYILVFGYLAWEGFGRMKKESDF
jgi:general stress protein CsbA